MSINKLIIELEETLAEYSPDTLASFLPPLPKEEVVSFFDRLGLHDEDLIELYTWRNGYHTGGNDFYDELWPFVGSFLSLDEIIMSIELNESLRIEDAAYSNDLICVFASGGEEYLFCKVPGENYGKIFFFDPTLGVDIPLYTFDSLASLINAIIILYKEKFALLEVKDKKSLDVPIRKILPLVTPDSGRLRKLKMPNDYYY